MDLKSFLLRKRNGKEREPWFAQLSEPVRFSRCLDGFCLSSCLFHSHRTGGPLFGGRLSPQRSSLYLPREQWQYPIFVAVCNLCLSSYIDHQDHTVHLKGKIQKMKLREDSVMTYSHQSPPSSVIMRSLKINETYLANKIACGQIPYQQNSFLIQEGGKPNWVFYAHVSWNKAKSNKGKKEQDIWKLNSEQPASLLSTWVLSAVLTVVHYSVLR